MKIYFMFSEHNRLRKDNVTILFHFFPMPYALCPILWLIILCPDIYDSLLTHNTVVLFLLQPLALVLGFLYSYIYACISLVFFI